MSDNQTKKGNARRKLLKGIAAGSGALLAGKNLPDTWNRPVVDAVMLPAHAQTSGDYAGTNRDIGLLEGGGLFANLSQVLIPEANAGPPTPQPVPPSRVDVSYCFSLNEDRTAADVQLIVTSYDYPTDGCNVNLLARVMNVPVGGGAVDIPSPETFGCENVLASWNKYLERSITGYGLFAKMGLVKDAVAGRPEFEIPSIEITEVNGTVNGIFDYLGFVDNFTIGLGPCPGYSPLCTEQCPDVVEDI